MCRVLAILVLGIEELDVDSAQCRAREGCRSQRIENGLFEWRGFTPCERLYVLIEAVS